MVHPEMCQHRLKPKMITTLSLFSNPRKASKLWIPLSLLRISSLNSLISLSMICLQISVLVGNNSTSSMYPKVIRLYRQQSSKLLRITVTMQMKNKKNTRSSRMITTREWCYIANFQRCSYRLTNSRQWDREEQACLARISSEPSTDSGVSTFKNAKTITKSSISTKTRWVLAGDRRI